MPKTSILTHTKGGGIRIAGLKGGDMRVADLEGGALKGKFGKGGGVKGMNRAIITAELKGGKIMKGKGYNTGIKVAEIQHNNPAPRELKKEMDRMATQGMNERGTLDTTRDALLMGIMNKLDKPITDKNQTHRDSHSGTHTGEGLTKSVSLDDRLHKTLKSIVKNKQRLNHLQEMGVNLQSYSPYVVKAVVDGDYRSFRTTNKHEWDRMINECALKGVQVNIMGPKTQFGSNLQGFLTNGLYGGEAFNTDIARNKEIDPPSTKSISIGHGLEDDGELNTMPDHVEMTPDKDSITSQIIHLSVNTGYNVALDFLNSVKGLFTKAEYADLYAYLGQNSLPLR